MIYAPESDQYMPQVMEDFNRAYAQGKNPVTGSALASGERPICITGQVGVVGHGDAGHHQRRDRAE